ncbi:Chitin synthase 6 [Psilocybe cubensis]|uniref:Chitin synthase 6 n=2 Tax=Psilocybe cubensis TaxID=181762 RepID=A0ACB8H4F8_PSICU|nr:Chitin synthase 6 [Psilocybe cubensis]KAH9482104.1 Chitin synthase 6 [Psilocybe cubensis]
MASPQTTQAIASGDLVDLVSSSGKATIYPSDDTLLAVLHARFRADLPYTRIGPTALVAVNPYKSLASTSDASAQEYVERCYRDTTPVGVGVGGPRPLQPHVYEMAATVYMLMRRRGESQRVLARGITGSGKTTSLRLLTTHLLRLSTHTKKEHKLADQIKSLHIVLDAFGNAKTLMSPNASRHGRLLELHFTSTGRIASAKVLTYALDKARLVSLAHEERTYHVFYQLLAGATPAERDTYQLEDPSEYALLASSGCYRLPAGPFSDDAAGMGELRDALRVLGFKPKHTSAIFSVLVAVLLLGNLEFADGDAHDTSAHVVNAHVLEHAARLLGVPPDELGQVLTNRTSYVRKELYTVLLNAEQSARQRDGLVRDLYAILFAFIVETCNHRLAPLSTDPPPHAQIAILDQAGFQSRGPSGTSSMSLSGAQPLISAYGPNTFDEFTVNFCDELVHSYVLRHVFDDSVGANAGMVRDGVGGVLPQVDVMDNGACVEMLRGAGLGERAARKPGGMLGVLGKACAAYKSGKEKNGENRDEEMVAELAAKFSVHSSFSAGGQQERRQFGVNHYAGSASYDARGFVEKDADLLDSACVALLRGSAETFVAKLFSGPSLAAERHSKDETIVVQAQVSSRPLRAPTSLPQEPDSEQQQQHPRLDPGKTYPVTTQLNMTLSDIFNALDTLNGPSSPTPLFTITCLRPNDSLSPNSFDKRRIKAQVRALLLPDLVARRSAADLPVTYTREAFCERYVPTMRGDTGERVRQCARANGWVEERDYVLGEERVWVGYGAWKGVEDAVRAREREAEGGRGSAEDEFGGEAGYVDDNNTDYTHGTAEGGNGNGLAPPSGYFGDSADNLLVSRTGADGARYHDANAHYGEGGLRTPRTPKGYADADDAGVWGSEYENEHKGSPEILPYGSNANNGGNSGTKEMVIKDAPNAVEELPTTTSRRWWLRLVWLTTWWIPSPLLRLLGRMKRPDVRLAWREKVTIFWLIFLFNAIVIFYIVEFGRLLCPRFDKVWSIGEVNEHQGDEDFWVAIQGTVYDVSNFVHGDHSNGYFGIKSNSPDVLSQMAGQDLTYYFPPPLSLGCAGLVNNGQVALQRQNWTDFAPLAHHVSGALQTQAPDMENERWYVDTFLKVMKPMAKGPLVIESKTIRAMAADDNVAKVWGVYENQLFDLTDYVFTLSQQISAPEYAFLDSDLVNVFKQRSGQDITAPLNAVLDSFNSTYRAQHTSCLKNVFLAGEPDFRKSARCQVQNYLLIVFSVIMMASILVKFLAALQLGSRRQPELQDKFVLCQVPCYTEGEDSLRRTIDSLAALNYDDKRKLIFIICDGNIIGHGNDRTTPRIVLDILGVDAGVDPEPLLFKSVGEGSKALNYGKVYSGLYEFEGHIVPYMVVVKVGKPTERSKPGNRGKRDSQILVMHYLNRVHFDAPMSPLELEIYHQMRNVIGIDPAFYEYIFTVDADTTVTPDSLNRLVACSADDSSIIGICGETKLTNEDGSWWTMIQVYEYYISHHLSKAFESLFGSVTCLPGCFSLYRIRTADKGRPIIISNRIIEEYAEPNIFNDAFDETFSDVQDQVYAGCDGAYDGAGELEDFVFAEEEMLPATVVYLIYLVIVVALKKAALPTIALIMLAVTYGLQALIFIIKREFMLVGWMIVYLLSYPVYSFFLPVYSFWCMDEFSWGNTRVVIGEGKEKKVITNEDEKFDESMIPLKKFSEYEAEAWETATRHSDDTGYDSKARSKSHGQGQHAQRSRDASPHANANAYNSASQSGDYYRDTNVMMQMQRTGGSQLSHSNVSMHLAGQQQQQQQQQQQMQQQQQTMSQYGMPQIPPFMPFGQGPGSVAGSDYAHNAGVGVGGMGMLPPLGYQNSGTMSMYGMMPPSLNPMMTGGAMSLFGAGGAIGGGGLGGGAGGGGGGGSVSGSQSGHGHGLGGGAMPPTLPQTLNRPMSTFSMATSVNPFAGPSLNPNPSDDELFSALRNYLSTQDLMSVTKKTAREAIAAKFPKADMASRKEFLNQSIDKILSES